MRRIGEGKRKGNFTCKIISAVKAASPCPRKNRAAKVGNPGFFLSGQSIGALPMIPTSSTNLRLRL